MQNSRHGGGCKCPECRAWARLEHIQCAQLGEKMPGCEWFAGWQPMSRVEQEGVLAIILELLAEVEK